MPQPVDIDDPIDYCYSQLIPKVDKIAGDLIPKIEKKFEFFGRLDSI